MEVEKLKNYIATGAKVVYGDPVNHEGDFVEKMTVDSFGHLLYGHRQYVVKIALRPLGDLKKEIEVRGEKFVPKEKLRELLMEKGNYTSYDISWVDLLTPTKLESLSMWLNSKLFEWNFDVFGWIPQGLALDLNKLENG